MVFDQHDSSVVYFGGVVRITENQHYLLVMDGVLVTAKTPDKVASIHFIAPVVPIEFSFLQELILPVVLPPIMENVFSQSFKGMFIDQKQMKRYWDLYQSKPYSTEKAGIFNDGAAPDWQVELEDAYLTIEKSNIPVWFLIARYDNGVVPDNQRSIASKMGAPLTELQSGHYIQLDLQASESVALIVQHLTGMTK